MDESLLVNVTIWFKGRKDSWASSSENEIMRYVAEWDYQTISKIVFSKIKAKWKATAESTLTLKVVLQKLFEVHALASTNIIVKQHHQLRRCIVKSTRVLLNLSQSLEIHLKSITIVLRSHYR